MARFATGISPMTKETFGDIEISQGIDCALVSFPYDKARTAAFREAFPKARWLPTTKTWAAPGKLAYKRAVKWASEAEIAETQARRHTEAVRRDAEFEGRAHEVDAAAALAHRRAEIRSARVRVAGASVSYDFKYSEAAVSIAKTLPKARFDREARTWTWTAKSIADVEAIIAGCNRIRDIAAAQIEAEQQMKARLAAEAEAARAQEGAARDAHMSHVRSHRFVALAASAPGVGAVLRRHGEVIVVESLGKTFRAGDDLSSLGGPIGAEGEWVRYVYFRAADAAETDELAARETAERAESARRNATRAAIDEIARSGDAPHVGAIPEGETIWRDDRARGTGYRRSIVLTSEGWLWHVVYDGSDGAAWGDYNLGYNTIGTRLRATPELLAAIRGERQ
jgi:hypothetical protein